jgi:hypothetical protein
MAAGNQTRRHEADIVAMTGTLCARIAQANDQPHRPLLR